METIRLSVEQALSSYGVGQRLILRDYHPQKVPAHGRVSRVYIDAFSNQGSGWKEVEIYREVDIKGGEFADARVMAEADHMAMELSAKLKWKGTWVTDFLTQEPSIGLSYRKR